MNHVSRLRMLRALLVPAILICGNLSSAMATTAVTQALVSAEQPTTGIQALKSAGEFTPSPSVASESVLHRARSHELDQGGEDIATATVISFLPFADTGTTVGHINDYDAPCPTGSAPDVVYSYTPVDVELVTLSLCGSTYDTKLFVMRNDPSDIVACNDDACGTQSQITSLELDPDNIYYIVIDGFGVSSGDYVFNMELTPSCVVTCLPSDIPECQETNGPEHASQDCDGGCNNLLYDGIPQYMPAFCNLGFCGSCFTYIGPNGQPFRDTDWYLLNVNEPMSLSVYCEAEFNVVFGVIAIGDCQNPQLDYYSTQPPCTPATVETPVLPIGPYAIFVAPTDYVGIPVGLAYRVSVSCTPGQLSGCMEQGFEDDFKLGPSFIGETVSVEVPFVNTSGGVLPEVTVASDAPFVTLPSSGPFIVLDGETLWVQIDYNPPAPGWVDCALILSNPGCDPFIGQLSVCGVPHPVAPGAPILGPGAECGSINLQIDRNGNHPWTEYVIAISTDNWGTTNFVQQDGSLGAAPFAAPAGLWTDYLQNGIGEFPPGDIVQARAYAQWNPDITPFGPDAQIAIPPCTDLPRPTGLVAQRENDDIVLNWDPVEYDESGMFPVGDVVYEVQAADDPDSPFTTIATTTETSLTLPGEIPGAGLRIYRVIATSERGPLAPAPQLTLPAPGEVVTGPFIMAAVDRGGGALLDGVSAVFQALIGGDWVDVTQRQLPQWIGGIGVWSVMVDNDLIPSGPCELRVVESGPFGTRIDGHSVIINRPPEPSILTTPSGEVVIFDGGASSDPDGSYLYPYWTLPDGTHQYGPSIIVETTPGDTGGVTLETNDANGVTESEQSGYACDLTGNCQEMGRRCGCKSMAVNTDNKIKGKNKSFPAGYIRDDGDANTKDDDQRLGPNSTNAAHDPAHDGDRTFASFNFEARAMLKYVAGNPSEGCTHYQKFQLDEKCNGNQIDTDDWYGQPDWDDHPIGGDSWADDDYDDETEDSYRINHDNGKNPEVDWIDAPSRGITGKALKDCAPGGLTYDCIFCQVVDGPEGCCRCRIRVKWTMGSNGQITDGPSVDKTNDDGDPNDDNLGCTTGAAGGCGC